MPGLASAQAYPTKPVRLVVGSAPGGTFDIVARLIAQWLSQRLGQQFVIDNRTGANTNIAANFVAHAAADGYTLLVFGVPATINATLYNNLGFDFERDIAPVASIESMPLLMVVHPALPATNVAQFIDYARDQPGKINMGSGGVGATGHVSGELFNMMAGLKVVHVPYRGEAPALADLLGGQVQVVFTTAASAINYVKASALRALAVSAGTTIDALPDVPPLAKFLPNYEASSWVGIGAPSGTPAATIDVLNRQINAALADVEFKAQLAGFGAGAMASSPADFGKFIAGETAKWAKVIKFANIKPE